METVYIQFSLPETETTSISEGYTKHVLKKFVKNALKIFFPVANPDFESKINEVKHWLVECDKTSGIPQREIGLDQQEQVIVKMPFKKNYGYWIDNNLLLDGFKDEFNAFEITKETFEQKWILFDSKSSLKNA